MAVATTRWPSARSRFYYIGIKLIKFTGEERKGTFDYHVSSVCFADSTVCFIGGSKDKRYLFL